MNQVERSLSNGREIIMNDIKELIEQEIRAYERDKNSAGKEAIKQQVMFECYNEFISVLKGILSVIDESEERQ